MKHTIYATYNDKTIRVYQAYNDTIADQAVQLGTFGSSFKMERMTWVKPSFLWMMYRSGWGTKDGQNRILAIDMKRTGFDYIVQQAVLSSYSKDIYSSAAEWKEALRQSDVRCQWDPERDIYGNPLDHRTIQLGIRGNAVKNYVEEWIVSITDMTQEVIKIREAIRLRIFSENMLPMETEYTFLSVD